MQLALPVWQQLLAPVFDTATEIELVQVAKEGVIGRQRLPLAGPWPLLRARSLVELGVDVLVCGAISRPAHMLLRSAGIQVHAWISGGLEEVLAAFLRGGLTEPGFAMPGCGRRRRMRGRGRQAGRRRGRGRGRGSR
ncbi:MAG: NifB/NifX family molybdenum-iron cluster-binding protein [Deltaproteobacteria bacterium]|nr:NifB/NifX family molybdenum-iron cluster-binding protein [Deltaproteobacteria bacterium]